MLRLSGVQPTPVAIWFVVTTCGFEASHDQRQLFLPVAEDGIGRFMGDGGSV